MADKNERLPQNVAGPFYVDLTCIDCDMCRGTAPDFFKRDDDVGFSIVYRQPATREEYELAEQARQGCPTDSIGNDGIDAPSREQLIAAPNNQVQSQSGKPPSAPRPASAAE